MADLYDKIEKYRKNLDNAISKQAVERYKDSDQYDEELEKKALKIVNDSGLVVIVGKKLEILHENGEYFYCEPGRDLEDLIFQCAIQDGTACDATLERLHALIERIESSYK